MAISTTAIEGDRTRIAVEGPMTIYEADVQRSELLRALAASTALEIDVGALDEIDTGGVQLLVLVRREAHQAGKPLRLAGQSPALAEALERYGLAAHFERAEDAGL